MFGRNKDDDAKGKKPLAGGSIAEAKPLPRPGTAAALNLHKPLPARPVTAATSRLADIPGMMSPRGDMRAYGVEGKTLVVGREISLAGQIAACDKLVVEGTVEAELDHCRQLDISPSGHFKGSAEIDEAEICGRFEGRLVVHKRLRVRTTARITGSITYGQIEVEAGGVMEGDIKIYQAPVIAQGSPAPGPSRGGAAAEAGE